MKKALKLLMLTISILLVSTSVFATEYGTMLISSMDDQTVIMGAPSNEIQVQLNGEYLDFTDENGQKVVPQIINDRTMVPMRKIFEVLGATITWDGDTKTVTGVKDNVTISLQIDNLVATKNANGVEEKITLDSAPTIVNGRTLVPVRFIAESLEKKVGWDAENRTVIVIDTSIAENMLKEKASNLYEYLTLDLVKINTCEMSLNLKGNVKYEDKETSKNNTSLNFVGDMDIKLSETVLAYDLELSFTGKGTLIERLKAQNIEKVKMNVIMDLTNNVMYAKIDGLQEFEEYGDKWIKADLGEDAETVKAALEMARKQDTTDMDVLVATLLPEDSLTVSSYTEYNTVMELLAMFMGNENFKISGRTDKTYTYSFDFSDIVKLLADQLGDTFDLELDENEFDFKVGFEIKVQNGVEKETSANLELATSTQEESLKIEVEVDGKLESYNEKVTVNMPKTSEVTELVVSND